MRSRINRKPAVAGIFYPSDPSSLRKVISELMCDQNSEDCFGIISPHAGYIYSGKITGKVVSRIKVKDKVVILCPNHTGYGVDISLFPSGSWLFPGFSVEIDDEVNSFLSSYDIFQLDTAAHLKEHSAEVIIPFLYHKNANMKISVLCLRTLDISVLEEIGKILSLLAQKYDILFVASSDMNHYEQDDVSREKDSYAIKKIKELDQIGLYNVIFEKDISMCGVAPVIALLFAAKYSGANKVELVDYTNSGEVTGDFSSVVGYAGFILYHSDA